MILNGKIVNLCKCFLEDKTNKVITYDYKSEKELSIEEQESLGLTLLGVGSRCGLLGKPMEYDSRLEKNPRGYFYKKWRNKNEKEC